MASLTLYPRGWNLTKVDAAYANVKVGPADSITETPDFLRFGQRLAGGMYRYSMALLEFDITDLADSRIESVSFRADTSGGAFDSVGPFLYLKAFQWTLAEPTEAQHRTPVQLDDLAILSFYDQASPIDGPLTPWDNGSSGATWVSQLQTRIDQGHDTFRAVLSTGRQATGTTPTDNEYQELHFGDDGDSSDAHITVVYHPDIDADEAAFSSPVTALAATVEPQERPAFSAQPPVLAHGNTTGPIPLASLTAKQPILAATTIRRWNHDEMFGMVADDGRRTGKVV